MEKTPSSPQVRKKADAVFEGGGVKGIGLVGALSVVEAHGYQLENIAGTSAGAIVAALVAAGYTAAELKEVMTTLDYSHFEDPGIFGGIPLVGPFIDLLIHNGLYRGNYAENLFGELLARKNVRTFGDLIMPEYKDDPRYRYKLQVIASDISSGRLLVLPRDAAEYGIDPDTLSVAKAIRMSMSIPYFFQPVLLPKTTGTKSVIVDGGVLSNFPVFLFDDGSANPEWPTFGFKLVDPSEMKPHTIHGPVTLFSALFATMMEAHDARYIQDHDFVRTIAIQTMGVQSTDFHLSAADQTALFQSGVSGAETFFNTWDFASYKQQFRAAPEPHRRTRMWQEMPN